VEEKMSDNEQCKPCPDGQVRRDGKCIMPEVTFAAFIMSLSSSALYHMGEIADPATGQRNKDLSLAKHTIDSLALLRDKTKGNLDAEEDELMKNILYDLKLRYVKAKG